MQKYKVNIIYGSVFLILCLAVALLAPWFGQFEWARSITFTHFVIAVYGTIPGILILVLGAHFHRTGRDIPLLRYVGYLSTLTVSIVVSAMLGVLTYLGWGIVAAEVVIVCDLYFGLLVVLIGVVAAMGIFPHSSYYRKLRDC
jgi:hypothetical protein